MKFRFGRYLRTRRPGIAIPGLLLSVASAPPANAIYAVGYDDTRQISNGVQWPSWWGAPYTVAVTAGSLPAGLSATVDMDGKLRINGVPSGAAGSFNFTLTVTDAVGATAILTTSITVPAFPAALTLAFGSKTRAGHGGHFLGNANGGALSITAGNGAGHWAIVDNRLVPAGTYGGASPTFAGPYNLTVANAGTGTSQTVTINMVANTLHVAVGTGANADTGSVFQLRTVMAGAILARGNTVICRNGYYNPTSAANSTRPAVSYSGAGRITVTSEWTDESIDATGERSERHGARWGSLWFSNAVSGDVEMPFTFTKIYFLNVQTTTPISLIKYSTSAGWGITANYCRFEFTGTHAAVIGASAYGFEFRGSTTTAYSCDHNYFVRGGAPSIVVGASTAGGITTGSSVVWNRIVDCPGDGISIALNNAAGIIVEDNFGCDFFFVSGAHQDFIQSGGNTTNTSVVFGSLSRNVFYAGASGDCQGLFLSDSTGTSAWTGAVIENNVIVGNIANGIFLVNFTNPSVRFNTLLTVLGGAYTATMVTFPNDVDGTYSYNACTAYSFAGTGSPVTVNNKSVTKSQAGYEAAFQAYDGTKMQSRKRVLQQLRAKVGGTLALSGGAYAGALKVDGSWNAGSA